MQLSHFCAIFYKQRGSDHFVNADGIQNGQKETEKLRPKSYGTFPTVITTISLFSAYCCTINLKNSDNYFRALEEG